MRRPDKFQPKISDTYIHVSGQELILIGHIDPCPDKTTRCDGVLVVIPSSIIRTRLFLRLELPWVKFRDIVAAIAAY